MNPYSSYFVSSSTRTDSFSPWIAETVNESKQNTDLQELTSSNSSAQSSNQLSMQQLIENYEQQYYHYKASNEATATTTDANQNNSKRRKTKFDIKPETIIPINSSFPTTSTSSSSFNEIIHLDDDDHHHPHDTMVQAKSKWLTADELLSMEDPSVIMNAVRKQISNCIQQSFQSAEDEAFKIRIKLALQKNFDFIEKKDRLALEQKLNGTEMNGIGYNVFGAPALSSSGIRNKFQDRFNKAKPLDRKGIGSAVENAMISKPAIVKNETTRIYVSGLPKDISEEEIEILFGPQGKIKKIKLYSDKEGNKKGDCLITYASPDSAVTACKLNNLNIGDGHILSVSKAEFPKKEQEEKLSKSIETLLSELLETLSSQASTGSSTATSIMLNSIPVGSLATEYPVMLIWNAYDLKDEDLQEIETDILLQACNFGNVKVIQMFEFAKATIEQFINSKLMNEIDEKTALSEVPSLTEDTDIGCVAITFETLSAAVSCQEFFSQQYFNNRKLFTYVYSSELLQLQQQNEFKNEISSMEDNLTVSTEVKVQNIEIGTSETIPNINENQMTVDEVIYDEEIQRQVEDVEDFLNSLL